MAGSRHAEQGRAVRAQPAAGEEVVHLAARAHLLLWSEAWEQTPCGSLPNDDELIALLLEHGAELFAKHEAVLMRGWWLAEDGRLYRAHFDRPGTA